MNILNVLKTYRLTIRVKIIFLAVASLFLLGLVGAMGYTSASSISAQSSKSLNEDADLVGMANTMREAHVAFQRQVQEWKDILLRGTDPELYTKYHDNFEKQYAIVRSKLSMVREMEVKFHFDTKDVDTLLSAHSELHDKYVQALRSFDPSHKMAGFEVDKLVRGIDRPTSSAFDKLATTIGSFTSARAEHEKQEVIEKADFGQFWILLTAGLALPLLSILAYFIVRSIIRKLDLFQKTIAEINLGDFQVRADTSGGDELADLARAFNNLLDSRVATLAQAEELNVQLNESVLGQLQAVAQLARKDLTVKVPVSEDVTGAVSDALNLLARETAKVLQEVSDISAEVTSASLSVQRQSDNMLLVAAEERGEMEHTAEMLGAAAHALEKIASLAQHSNAEADNAVHATREAQSTVDNTVRGINSARDVIRETEKRIKRLGERSQEISGAVNLINVIAERTHILALNASMHAASAGEAGRGFAVVADEVQRLAENSRQATQQISALVSNIQVETADTVNTMNNAITQIVEGSRLAEQAGQQMQATEQATADLVASVKQIADSSAEQAKAGQELINLAAMIRISSEKTSEKLLEQSNLTSGLVDYAKRLLATVRVFKLPG